MSVRLESFTDISVALPGWRLLEASGAVMTPYQRSDWVEPWLTYSDAKARFLCIQGWDDGDVPVFVLPLVVHESGPLRIASFPGGSHSNANAPILRPDGMDAPFDATAVLGHIERLHPEVDVLWLRKQPLFLCGVDNPFAAAFPSRPSVDHSVGGTIPDASIRPVLATRRLLRKERKACEMGQIRYWQPSGSEIGDVLQTFFLQKGRRLRAAGKTSAFDGGGLRNFLTATTGGDAPSVELFAMSIGDEIAAVYGGTAAGAAFSFSFNSVAGRPLSRVSPGLLLLGRAIEMLRERGIAEIDMGVGPAHYKSVFGFDLVPLVDAVVPLSSKGRAFSWILRARSDVERALRASPLVKSAFSAVRRLMASGTST